MDRYLPLRALASRLPLVIALARREIVGRYRGSMLGLFWSFVNPLLMLSVYTFVFSMVFKARWGGAPSSRFDFALTLFCGLIFFNLFAECATKAPNLILSNVNFVKKVIFPLEILPLVSYLSALFHAAISLGVLLIFLFILGPAPSWTILLLPLILVPFSLMILGFSWLLSSIGVYLRDIGQFIGMGMTVLMFMSPIFYPASALPERIRGYLFLNPLVFVIEEARKLLLQGQWPDWQGLFYYSAASLLVFISGYSWFQKTRKGFADVL